MGWVALHNILLALIRFDELKLGKIRKDSIS